MPSLFCDDTFVAQIDKFEHQMVVVQRPTGEFVDAYGVNCGPYMMLFHEDELDQFVALAKALQKGMQQSKQSEAAGQTRAIAAILAEELRTQEADPSRRPSAVLAAQIGFAANGRQDN